MAVAIPHPHLPHSWAEAVADVVLVGAMAAVVSAGAYVAVSDTTFTGPATTAFSTSQSPAVVPTGTTFSGPATGNAAAVGTSAFATDGYPWPERLAGNSVGTNAFATDDYPWPERLAGN